MKHLPKGRHPNMPTCAPAAKMAQKRMNDSFLDTAVGDAIG